MATHFEFQGREFEISFRHNKDDSGKNNFTGSSCFIREKVSKNPLEYKDLTSGQSRVFSGGFDQFGFFVKPDNFCRRKGCYYALLHALENAEDRKLFNKEFRRAAWHAFFVMTNQPRLALATE